MTKLKTYVFALQTTIVLKPTVYYEIIAESAKEARKMLTKTEVKYIVAGCKDSFIDEAKTDLDDGAEVKGPTKVIECGLASQYHNSKECDLCIECNTRNLKRVA